MKGAARLWPAQNPAEGFAERVVRAALAERSERASRATFASVEPIDVEPRGPSKARPVARRRLMGATLALGLGVMALCVGRAWQEETDTSRETAARGYAWQRRKEELVAQLEKLTIEEARLRSELEERLKDDGNTSVPASVPRMQRPAAKLKAAPSAGKTSKQSCRCPAGDALCSCL